MSTAMRGKEILSLRTENGKVYQTGPQRYRSVTYLDTIHYLDEKSGEYRLIDNRLIQDRDRLYNKDNPTLRVELTPEYISLRSAKGTGLSWYLEGAKPCPPRIVEQETKEELDQIRSSAVYKEILPGADLRCEISGNHFKDEIVFRTSESADKAVFELRVRELSPRQEGEDILLTDAAGETVFILPPPVCMDSSKDAEPVQASCKLEGTDRADTWRLICSLPEKWLESAVYPVILDPAVVTYKDRKSTRLNSSHPTTSRMPSSA